MANAKETLQRKGTVETFTDIHKINVHMTNKINGGTDEIHSKMRDENTEKQVQIKTRSK